jgi:hypothetical protein
LVGLSVPRAKLNALIAALLHYAQLRRAFQAAGHTVKQFEGQASAS